MAKKSTPAAAPAVVVIFGDEPYAKATTLQAVTHRLLPRDADPRLSVVEYDGTKSEEQGGPTYVQVIDDVATPSMFGSGRRIVIVHDADKFVTAARERLERYLASPAPGGTLILVCRSFLKTTRLYKAAAAVGEMLECKKLSGRVLVEFICDAVRKAGKRIDPPIAARLAELIGAEQGVLTSEVEKLCIFVGARPAITSDDITALIGETREERIFGVMDSAAAGRLSEAIRLWHQVLDTDKAAAFKALGGIAFVLRKWLAAQEMRASGMPVGAIAPKVMMWNRERELDSLLRRLSAARMRGLLASVAELDAQAKSGLRSIETGVEALLVQIAA